MIEDCLQNLNKKQWLHRAATNESFKEVQISTSYRIRSLSFPALAIEELAKTSIGKNCVSANSDINCVFHSSKSYCVLLFISFSIY